MGEHLEQILDAYWFMAQQGKVEVQRPASVAAIEALIRRREAEAVIKELEDLKATTYATNDPSLTDMLNFRLAELQRLRGE